MMEDTYRKIIFILIICLIFIFLLLGFSIYYRRNDGCSLFSHNDNKYFKTTSSEDDLKCNTKKIYKVKEFNINWISIFFFIILIVIIALIIFYIFYNFSSIKSYLIKKESTVEKNNIDEIFEGVFNN